MRYLVIEQTETDWFVDEYETKDQAVREADTEWSKKSEDDKNRATAFYILESVNPDEDAADHFDGDIVKDYKEG